jgi:hypothetical protein
MASPLILSILSVFKSQGLNQARQALLGASKDFNSLAGTIGKAAGAFSAFQALTSASQFATGAIELTQRYERNLIALGQVFEEVTPKMEAFTREVENYGLSQSQAAQASVFLGSVLKQYGFSIDESAGQTQRLVKLAQDLAVTYGYDVQEALLAITALFRGEYDPIEKFGVAMKQNEVNARVAADGFGDLTGAELANAQATARLTMLFERATDSVGAFERAGNTLYASQSLLAAATENLQVAFGAPLQEPIAAIINSFAEVVNGADGVVDIGFAIGEALEVVGPTFGILADLLVQLLGPLQQVIEFLGSLLTVALVPINVILGFLVNALEDFNQVLDIISIVIGNANDGLSDFLEGPAADFLDWLNSASEDSIIIQAIISLIEQFEKLDAQQRGYIRLMREDRSPRDYAAMQKELAFHINKTSEATDKAIDPFADYIQKLKDLKIYTVDADGALTGLAGILMEIEVEARKSEVADALKEMGFQAGQIEYMLTKPDWENIFKQITRLAQIAALDIQKAFAVSIGGAAMILNAKAELEKLLKSDLGGSSKKAGEKQAIDYVEAFTKALKESAQQRAARLQLELLGATAGLIDRILGAENWMKVWIAIKSGTLSVKDLQRAFNMTAEGAKETAENAEAVAEKLRKIQEASDATKSILDRLIPREELPRFQSDVRDIFDDLKAQVKDLLDSEMISAENAKNLGGWADSMQAALMNVARQRDEVAQQIEKTEERISKIKGFGLSSTDIRSLTEPMSLIAEQVGEYESQVIDNINSMREKIREGVELEIFNPRVASQLSALVDATRDSLIRIARDRQAIAAEMQRLQDALTFRNATKEAILAYADVTKILSQATDRLQSSISGSSKSTFEIVAQTIKSARNARDYRVILVKELEEAEKASASAGDITDGLKKVLEDTRLFARNLDALRSLGLDAKVYEQIVAAGMEVGNKTAQAIIDGGPEVVREINSLWEQIGIYSENGAVIAADKVYGLGGDVIEAAIAGLRSKDGELIIQAATASFNMVNAFQGQVDSYKVSLDNLLASLKANEERLKQTARELGAAFAAEFQKYINMALAGMKVPVPPPVIVPKPTTPEPEKPVVPVTPEVIIPPALPEPTNVDVTSINGDIQFLIDSQNDISRLVAYLNQRIIAANEFAANALRAGNRAASLSAQETAQDMLRTLKEVRNIQYNNDPRVININVKTDTTQSLAMVGKTIGRTVTKYVTGGGGIVVSPVG